MGLSGVKAIAAGDNYAIAILTNSPIADTATATTVSSPSNQLPIEVVSLSDNYKTSKTIIPGENLKNSYAVLDNSLVFKVTFHRFVSIWVKSIP